MLRPRKNKVQEAQDITEPRDIEHRELLSHKEVPVAQEDVLKRPVIKNVLSLIQGLYPEDLFFQEIWKNTDRNNRFERKRDLLWTKN